MTRLLALLLLAGSLVLLGAAAFHPILPLTAEGDLGLMAHTPHWRLIHLGLMYATGLIIAGVWARWLIADPAERAPLGVALLVVTIGEALHGVNITYMAGAGTEFAAAHASGADVREVYLASHAAAIMTGRLGGFLVALGAGLVAWVTSRSGRDPRWLVGLAAVTCVVGLAGNFFAVPGQPLMVASIGLMALWQAATAVRVLREPSAISRQVSGDGR
ncbi:MAG: hypothetical protein ABI587_13630 [Gemmatimonadales bacterium]